MKKSAAKPFNILYDCGTLADFPYRKGKKSDKSPFIDKFVRFASLTPDDESTNLSAYPRLDVIIISHPDRDHKSLIESKF